MPVSSEMKLRLDKIDKLVAKGYLVKTKDDFPIPSLISPEGKFVNIYFKSKYGDEPLQDSHDSALLPFVLATKIRDWKYFWFLAS